jgi:hypothetical protein
MGWFNGLYMGDRISLKKEYMVHRDSLLIVREGRYSVNCGYWVPHVCDTATVPHLDLFLEFAESINGNPVHMMDVIEVVETNELEGIVFPADHISPQEFSKWVDYTKTHAKDFPTVNFLKWSTWHKEQCDDSTQDQI